MSGPINFADVMAAWAAKEPSIQALVLIGSRVRDRSDEVWRADAHSDWDFHVITSRPQIFMNPAWTRELEGMELKAYVARSARIGGVPKINAVFREAEADFVVLPSRTFRTFKLLTSLGMHRGHARLQRKLQELAVVIRPGWRFLKGKKQWEPFYQRSVSDVSDPRLTDDAVRSLADGFVCDYVCITRKIARGELLAAQRLMHRDLAEVNFRLLHELRLRRGERSFPEVRRIERIATAQETSAVTISANIDATSLQVAVAKSAETCRGMMKALVGETWRWPNVEE